MIHMIHMKEMQGYVREIEVATGGRPTKKLLINPCDKRAKRDKRWLADGR